MGLFLLMHIWAVHWKIRKTYTDYCAYIVLKSVPQRHVGLGKFSWTEVEPQILYSEVRIVKKIVMDSFADHCITGLLPLNVHLLDNIVDDLYKCGMLSFL